MKSFYSFGTLLTIFTIVLTFSLCLFIPIFAQYGTIDTYNPSTSNLSLNLNISNVNLLWPTPGYTTITSGFGYRKSPTNGAGIYHGGIDIGAPKGTNIIACEAR